jgi:hypothetical protein
MYLKMISKEFRTYSERNFIKIPKNGNQIYFLKTVNCDRWLQSASFYYVVVIKNTFGAFLLQNPGLPGASTISGISFLMIITVPVILLNAILCTISRGRNKTEAAVFRSRIILITPNQINPSSRKIVGDSLFSVSGKPSL